MELLNPKFLFLNVCLFFILNASAVVQDPQFVKMKDWKIEKVGFGKLELTCKAVFFNPNKAKAKLDDLQFNVAIGETRVGKITQVDGKVKIKKQQAFEIPLKLDIEPESNAWEFVNGIWNTLTLHDFTIQIEGFLKVKVVGIPIKIPVKEKEVLNLKNVLP